MKPAASTFSLRALALIGFAGGLITPTLTSAQEAATETTTATDDGVAEVVVKAKVNQEVNILSNDPVESVFGFDKTIKDTPRSVTTISQETLNKLNINELDDLVALSPGSFTQSFFGVAGSLDLRGTPGEVYFRGVRRIENPGNYPTPIGASDRIDIVRGPASPIYGPSKIGGYLNFVPKSGRAEDGAYMKEPMGEVGVTRGSWDKDVMHGEVGGPGKMFGKDFGYYFYAEVEDSGSYYQNTSTDQSIYQASFDMQLSDSTKIEFGSMYHNYEGNQVAGWNRVTQDLIDNGTYITGTPASLDTDGDGRMSAAESAAGNLFSFFFLGVGAYSAEEVNAALDAQPNLALLNPGTTHINGNQVLVDPADELVDSVATFYFDITHQIAEDLTLTNKSFYESLENNNENAYGFSQYADTWAFEDQLILAYSHQPLDWLRGAYQLSPSLRHQDFEHGDNYAFEYFDRRDITGPNTPASSRTLSTRDGSTLEPFSNHVVGNYTDLGLAFLTDLAFFDDLHLLAGGRYDSVDVESTCLPDATNDYCDGVTRSGSDTGLSWSASLSYDVVAAGLTPYVTTARQSTLITGQGGQVPTDLVVDKAFFGDSTLLEYGVKGSFIDDRLYASLAQFEQERVDYNAQDTVTNNTTLAKGVEFEFRGVVTNNLAITGAFTSLEVYNVPVGSLQFSFAGAEDLPEGVDPSKIFGGTIGGVLANSDSRKAGIPENIYSLYLIYNFDQSLLPALDGLTATVGMTHADSTYSGWSQSVTLPSYTLVNAGLNYETKRWKFGLQGKNLTDERYFRSNFPDLFGSSVVLPELPRNFLVSTAYKF